MRAQKGKNHKVDNMKQLLEYLCDLHLQKLFLEIKINLHYETEILTREQQLKKLLKLKAYSLLTSSKKIKVS